MAILIISGCALDTNHEKEILHFRQKRINYLKSRQGYLNLVGLYWFYDGEYQMGSGQDNDMILPIGFPKLFGSFSKIGKQLKFQFNMPVLIDSINQVTEFLFSTEQLDHTFSWNYRTIRPHLFLEFLSMVYNKTWRELCYSFKRY